MIPTVSIIIPCYNEEATIQLLLAALACQTYPLAEMEVIIADGLSTDRTRSIIAGFQADHPDLSIVVVDNPKKIIPAGLNTALSIAKGSMIVRLDAHSIPQNDYIERSIVDLENGLGDNVGGVWDIHPGGQGWMSQVIAAVAAHPLAVGDARYRFSDQAGPVDTVPFGAFRRELIDRIGAFDETLLTNEDYEFNTRIRQHGGRVWLDPAIRCVYFARADLKGLGRQYWRYGYWKARMLRRYPGTLRWRQALPPAFVISLVILSFLSIVFIAARFILALELLLYAIALLIAAVQMTVRKRDLHFLPGVPLAIATMHLNWGTGFLWSIFDRK